MILNKQTIFLQNIRSLQKNFGLLNIHLKTLKCKPIALYLTEAWLKNHYQTSQFSLKEYQKLCSSERRKRGGVGIFVVNDLVFVEVKRCDHNNLQALTIKIKADKQHFLIITCVYILPRKQNIGKFQRLENFLDTLPIDPEDKHILCGDFNINFLVNGANFQKIVTLLAGKNLSIVENVEPTRETSSTKSTLDAFF